MQMNDSNDSLVSDKVWRPSTIRGLKACIPGCQTLGHDDLRTR